MKKYYSLAIILILSLSLTGCIVPTMTELTDEQEKLITEYAAGLLLKYDSNGNNGLLTDEQLQKAEAEEEEQRAKEERTKQLAREYLEKAEIAKQKKEEEKAKKKAQKGEGAGSSAVAAGPVEIAGDGIASFVELDGVSVEYTGYEIKDTYPDDAESVFVIDAAQGKKLVVLNMTISNTSSEDKSLDIFSNKAEYYLQIDENTVANSNTLLLNDFSIYRDTVAAGTSVPTVLLFEVDENSAIASGADGSAVLLMKNNGSTGTINIY